MKLLLKCFCNDSNGAAAIEYGLIAAGIGVTLFVTLSLLGVDLSDVFTSLSDEVSSQVVD